jgi:hypothetical protein
VKDVHDALDDNDVRNFSYTVDFLTSEGYINSRVNCRRQTPMSLGYPIIQGQSLGKWSWRISTISAFKYIQIMNNPYLIGYILIYSGEDSCREEAQARAMRMKKYMMKVRGIQGDRVMWRDGGRYRGEGLEIFLLGIPRDKLATTDFQYEPPAVGKVIRPCKRKRSGYDARG